MPLPTQTSISRRDLLKLTGRTLLFAGVLSAPLVQLAQAAPCGERCLSFYNTHTSETLKRVPYWADGQYQPDALQELNVLLRDHRNGKVTAMDRKLFDLLYVIQSNLGCHQPFHIISGYRSPETNAFLRQHSSGVAKHSLHLIGKAVDIRLPHVDLTNLRAAALQAGRGGVGFYPGSQFVHVDTGRVRQWHG